MATVLVLSFILHDHPKSRSDRRIIVETTLETTQKWGVLVAVGIGTFMTALDTSVVNTVLPVIGKNFNEAITNVEWVVTIYLLVLSGLLLEFWQAGGYARAQDDLSDRVWDFYGWLIILRDCPECGYIDRISWAAGIGGSNAGSQFTSDFNQKLSSSSNAAKRWGYKRP